MSIAARRSHRGDEYQLDIAVHWLIRLLHEDDLDWVQVDSVVLPDDVDVVLVDDVVVLRMEPSNIVRQKSTRQIGESGLLPI